MAAYGLYSHIRANRVRSAFLLIGLFFLIYLMVFAGALVAEAFTRDETSVEQLLRFAERDFRQALPFATVGAALWVILAYYFHQSLIDAVTGGEEVSRAAEPRLYNLLENLCISRGIPMPKLKVIDTDVLNAFASGMNQRQYSVTVTRGLLDNLDDKEVEAVLGHELTHIRNGDVKMMVIAVVIAGVISFFAELFFRVMFQGGFRVRSSGDRKGGAVVVLLIAVALVALAWLLSIVIRFALSRKREYLADAGSVELTKDPDAMISALRKIEGRGELPGSTSAVMEMCIDNPREGFSDIFATHPPVESRVDALVKFAGGHDPGPLALPMPKDMQHEDSDGEKESDEAPRPQIPPPTEKMPPVDEKPPAAEPPKPFGHRQGGPWGPKPGEPWGG
ncbi:MAG TPA: M48 family metallopeptidase [Xanthobacteraceae bacterium]|nr:M48 family metallopeptidase [Xanthobacteraceae bacterium]